MPLASARPVSSQPSRLAAHLPVQAVTKCRVHVAHIDGETEILKPAAGRKQQQQQQQQ